MRAVSLKPLAVLNPRGAFVTERVRPFLAELPANTAALLRAQWHWILLASFLVVILIAPAYWTRFFWFQNESAFWYQPYIPLLALWSVWHWRHDLQNIYANTLNLPESSPQRRGKLWPLLIGCAIMLLAYATQTSGLSILAWVVMTLGIIYYAFGRTIMAHLLPELILVLTMIPPPVQLIIEFQRSLQLAMTSIGADTLRNFGVADAKASGNFLEMGKSAFEVTPGISGVAILVPLLALVYWFVVLRRLTVGLSVTLFAVAAILGLLVLVVRVVTTGLLVHGGKADLAAAFVLTPSWIFVLLLFTIIWFVSRKMRLR